jgi:hypothetical protein
MYKAYLKTFHRRTVVAVINIVHIQDMNNTKKKGLQDVSVIRSAYITIGLLA